MVSKKVLVTGLAAVAAVVLFSGFAHGRGWAHNPERIRQMVTWKLDDKLDDLDATDAQRKAIHALKDDLLREGQSAFEGHHAVRQQFLAQLESPNPDAAQVHALVDQRVEAMRALAHKAADAALEAHRVLTPAQREELAKEARKRMDAHR